MSKLRHDRPKAIAKVYEDGPVNCDLTISRQMAYEWNQDFHIMRYAFYRVDQYLKRCRAKGITPDHDLYIMHGELSRRIGIYNCASLKKNHLECGYECICKPKTEQNERVQKSE